MKTDRLKLPDEYTLDDDCMKNVLNHLCDYIVKRTIAYNEELGLKVYLAIPMEIKYNHHSYWTNIVKDNKDKYYWYMRGYKIKSFIVSADDIKSFELVIEKILLEAQDERK